MARLSTLAVSTRTPALKVLSTTLPDRTCLSLVRTNAGPLPGLTCWNSTTVHSWPSMFSTMPFFRSFVVATGCVSCCVGEPPGYLAAALPRRGRQQGGHGAQRELVGQDAETGHGAGRDARDDRGVPELLAGRRVGQVDLDQRRRQLGAGVAQRVGVVGERGRVEHDRGARVGRGVQPADQLRLVVGLPYLDLQPQRGAGHPATLAEHRVVKVPVHLGLAAAEATEVGPVEDQDCRHEATSAYACDSQAGSGSASATGWPICSRTMNRS